MPLNDSITTIYGFINDKHSIFISYIPLVIIVLGLIGNSISFIVFCFDKIMNKISFSVYFIFIAITDTLALFVWNLDNFLAPNFGIRIENFGIASCKISSFLQHFSFYSSNYLLCLVTIDRYVTVISTPGSFANKLPFRTVKSAKLWSLFILLLMFLINSHLLIFNTTDIVKIKETLDSNFSAYQSICYNYPDNFYALPLIEKSNMVFHTLIPSMIMIIFNSLLLKKSLTLNKNNKLKTGQNRKHHITVTLLVLSFSFIAMTAPGQLIYGFFDRSIRVSKYGKILADLLDDLLFFSNTTIFYTCFLTNRKFREAFYEKFNFISRFKKYQVKA